eukprot:SAG31_NODE_1651_length_7634_cov_5.579562_3_plen_47_part_00
MREVHAADSTRENSWSKYKVMDLHCIHAFQHTAQVHPTQWLQDKGV